MGPIAQRGQVVGQLFGRNVADPLTDAKRGSMYTLDTELHGRQGVCQSEPAIIVSVPVEPDVGRPETAQERCHERDQSFSAARHRVPRRIAETEPLPPGVDGSFEQLREHVWTRTRRVFRDETKRKVRLARCGRRLADTFEKNRNVTVFGKVPNG